MRLLPPTANASTRFHIDQDLNRWYTNTRAQVMAQEYAGGDRERAISGERIMMPYEPSQVLAADADLLQCCKQDIRAVAGDADVILYGSRARGHATDDSDYDLLVLVDQPVDVALRERLVSAVYPLELETGAVLTLMVYNRARWNSPLYRAMPFRRNVQREGVLL